MSTGLPLRLDADTHTGLVHKINEDVFGTVDTPDGKVLIVCDGMGGMGRGDAASRIALDALTESLATATGTPAERLQRAVITADITVRDRLCRAKKGRPGCTVAMAFVVDGYAHVAWVGDSRVYHLRGAQLLVHTKDHKLIETLIASGKMTREESKKSRFAHVITQALGGRSPDEPAVEASLMGPWALQKGDTLLVCSDGVCDLIEDDEIGSLIVGKSPKQAVQQLISTVLQRGAHDNTTAIVAIWEGAAAVDLVHKADAKLELDPIDPPLTAPAPAPTKPAAATPAPPVTPAATTSAPAPVPSTPEPKTTPSPAVSTPPASSPPAPEAKTHPERPSGRSSRPDTNVFWLGMLGVLLAALVLGLLLLLVGLIFS